MSLQAWSAAPEHTPASTTSLVMLLACLAVELLAKVLATLPTTAAVCRAVRLLSACGADCRARWKPDDICKGVGVKRDSLTTQVLLTANSPQQQSRLKLINKFAVESTLWGSAVTGREMTAVHLAALTAQPAILRLLVSELGLPVDVSTQLAAW